MKLKIRRSLRPREFSQSRSKLSFDEPSISSRGLTPQIIPKDLPSFVVRCHRCIHLGTSDPSCCITGYPERTEVPEQSGFGQFGEVSENPAFTSALSLELLVGRIVPSCRPSRRAIGSGLSMRPDIPPDNAGRGNLLHFLR